MAIFKPFRGNSAGLDTVEKHDGYAYFCTDSAEFFIDYIDKNGELQRKQLNANDAKTLLGATLVNEMTDSELEIPTGAAVMKALDDRIVQSDWNQNDESKPDFIKNRTHYVKGMVTIEEPLIEEQDVEFDLTGPPYGVYQHNIVIENGANYRMKYDGTYYDLTGERLQVEPGILNYVGNLSILNDAIGVAAEDTGEPFVLYTLDTDDIASEERYIVTLDTATSHTLALSKMIQTEDICKLDPKYLPDGGFGYAEPVKPLTHDGNNEGKILHDESNGYIFAKISDVLNPYDITKIEMLYGGSAISITKDDIIITTVDYGYTIAYENAVGIFIINKTGDPYFDGEDLPTGTYVISMAEAQTYVTRIEFGETVHPIDPKYLPAGGFGYEDLYEGKITYTFDGNFDNALDVILLSEEDDVRTYFAKISNNVPSMESVIGGTTTILDSGKSLTVELTEDVIVSYTEDGMPAYGIYEFIIVAEEDFSFEDIFLTKGIWVACVLSKTNDLLICTTELSFYETENRIHKIDGKFLHQTDWNQNDSTKPDYIQNRPFYDFDTYDEVVVIPETTVPLRQNGAYWYFQSVFYKVLLVPGHEYRAVLNGSEYVGRCESKDGIPYIGNLRYMDANEVDTGEEFLVMTPYTTEDDGTIKCNATIATVVTNSATVALYEKVTVQNVKQIDPKYLPTGGFGYEDSFSGHISYSFDGNLNNYECVNAGGWYLVKVSDNTPAVSDLIGGTLTVNDGTNIETYEITEDVIDDGSEAGIPVYIICGQLCWIFLTDVSEGGLEVTKGIWFMYVSDSVYTQELSYEGTATIIHKIDEKYLPKLTWDTIGSKRITIANNTFVGFSGGVLQNRIEDGSIQIPLTEGATYDVTFDGKTYTCQAYNVDNLASAIGNFSVLNQAAVDTGEPFLIVSASDGTIIVCEDKTSTTHTIAVYVTTITKIDKKYLPDNELSDIESSGVLASNVLSDMLDLGEGATVDDAFESFVKDASLIVDKMAELQEQVDSLNEDVVAVEVYIGDFNSELSALQEDTETLKARVDNMEEIIDSNPGNSSIRQDYIVLKDVVNGFDYIIQMQNGNLISRCRYTGISVTTQPDRVVYDSGDYFDPTGMIVAAIAEDGSSHVVNNYTISCIGRLTNETEVVISYTDCGVEFTTSVAITVIPFEAKLIDFEYTAEDDGTYTLTNWKGTCNGEPSTECIIPDYNCIRL